MKRIPYGVSDFKQIRREGLYYVDMMTDLQRYPMVAHSYILELKYLKKDASASEAAEQWRQAVDQIRRYAKSEAVNRMTAHTQLHLLVLQIQGFDMTRCEEVAAGE
jgi:hypothetical protein